MSDYLNEEERTSLKRAIRCYPDTTFFNKWSDSHGKLICFRPVVIESETPDGEWLMDYNKRVHEREKLYTERDLQQKEPINHDNPF